jgi:hypothetical protein
VSTGEIAGGPGVICGAPNCTVPVPVTAGVVFAGAGLEGVGGFMLTGPGPASTSGTTPLLGMLAGTCGLGTTTDGNTSMTGLG